MDGASNTKLKPPTENGRTNNNNNNNNNNISKGTNFNVKHLGDSYNIYEFLNNHPGGINYVKPYKEKDVTQRMQDTEHSRAAYYLLREYKTGGRDRTQKKDQEDLEALVDWDKPMLSQVASLGPRYSEWVISPVDRQLRLFGNPILENLTITPWYVVPMVWIPVITYFVFYGSKKYVEVTNDESPLLPTVLSLAFGVALWTLIEYSLHRWVFHMEPSGRSKAMIYVHFAIHGLHHKVPFDPRRLVFPPFPAAIIAYVLYQICKLFVPESIIILVVAGGLTGYVIYDMIHFYLHYGSPKEDTYLYHLKRYHNQHHFAHHDSGTSTSSSHSSLQLVESLDSGIPPMGIFSSKHDSPKKPQAHGMCDYPMPVADWKRPQPRPSIRPQPPYPSGPEYYTPRSQSESPRQRPQAPYPTRPEFSMPMPHSESPQQRHSPARAQSPYPTRPEYPMPMPHSESQQPRMSPPRAQRPYPPSRSDYPMPMPHLEGQQRRSSTDFLTKQPMRGAPYPPEVYPPKPPNDASRRGSYYDNAGGVRDMLDSPFGPTLLPYIDDDDCNSSSKRHVQQSTCPYPDDTANKRPSSDCTQPLRENGNRSTSLICQNEEPPAENSRLNRMESASPRPSPRPSFVVPGSSRNREIQSEIFDRSRGSNLDNSRGSNLEITESRGPWENLGGSSLEVKDLNDRSISAHSSVHSSKRSLNDREISSKKNLDRTAAGDNNQSDTNLAEACCCGESIEEEEEQQQKRKNRSRNVAGDIAEDAADIFLETIVHQAVASALTQDRTISSGPTSDFTQTVFSETSVNAGGEVTLDRVSISGVSVGSASSCGSCGSCNCV